MNQATLEELEARFDALDEDRVAIAYALRREADALRGEGELKLRAIVEATKDFLGRWRDVAERVFAADDAQACSGELPLPSLPAMRGRLDLLLARLPAQAALRELRSLVDDGDSTNLQVIQEAVRRAEAELEAASELADLPMSFRDELSSEHPLGALRRLADPSSDLADNEWDACVQRVRNAFGTEVGVAAARGRLRLEPLSTTPLRSRVS